ncbi:P-II family nitrogen regulator [Anaerocolumna sp. MB42-C2]|uniref:P-II family nitrogen regulator n=1 Tax=Anaerocolumna sp. MB42-C2 TaxID=3070997 RepID=UPI0027E0A5F5|nr:P-II family nitrogen regulator [Anaerocolumna sp. MB42-C2]WMJ88828.1 P-II family nitrogen regulator [Anaerocolumna sp. MB42-C2]
MKEILAFIRMNKINQTKQALLEAGYPAMTCRNCMGRGKQIFNMELVDAIAPDSLPLAKSENLLEAIRLFPKRYINMFVQNEDVNKIINIIMDVNSTGNPGDGKIFVLPVMESLRVRDGSLQSDNDSY